MRRSAGSATEKNSPAEVPDADEASGQDVQKETVQELSRAVAVDSLAVVLHFECRSFRIDGEANVYRGAMCVPVNIAQTGLQYAEQRKFDGPRQSLRFVRQLKIHLDAAPFGKPFCIPFGSSSEPEFVN